MPILGRDTLKSYFSTGKPLTNQKFRALIDSGLNKLDTTAQSLPGDLSINQLIATAGVSAGEANVTQFLQASAANFSGLVRHGVSAAVSASATRAYALLNQRATAAASATTQFALMPDSSNIVSLGLHVLQASSGAGGGTQIFIGNGAAYDYFGERIVSAAGVYRLEAVCARRYAGVSGAMFAVAPTATAGTNFVPFVDYYRIPVAAVSAGASAASLTLSFVSTLGSAIGNMVAGGGLAAAFNSITSQDAANCAQITSSRGFAGQAWDAPKRIGQFAAWDPNNEGFCSNGGSVTIRLKGNNSNDFAGAVTLASTDSGYTIPTIVATVDQANVDTTNSYAYHWVEVSGGGGGSSNHLAEAQFWELV